MEILENRLEWEQTFKANWLAHFQATGETKWDIYNRPNNKTTPSGKGIDLRKSKLLLISSAGSYLKDSQIPYDAANLLGDYSIRMIPMDSDFSALDYAHEHYDHSAVLEDPQVLIPLDHLKNRVKQGHIGSLTEDYISFMGYQPDISQVLDETIPLILNAAKEQTADAVLLVPS